jgi:hypothetical protein
MGAHSPHLQATGMGPDESASTIAHPGSTEKSAALGVPVVLRDGSRLRIRQWRPSDRDQLVSGFYRLSPTSRYRRGDQDFHRADAGREPEDA